MIEVQANQRLLLLISESKGVGTGWKSHQRDQDKYLPFCAYIGGNSKEELKSVVADLDCSKVQIRKAKRLTTYPFEAKIWGAPFEDVRNLGFWLSVASLNRVSGQLGDRGVRVYFPIAVRILVKYH